MVEMPKGFPRKYLTPEKRITVSVYGSVDTTPVQKIIDHHAFQRTRRIKQLGIADSVFPSATHTRFAHMVQAMAQCLEYTEKMVLKGMLSPEEAHACNIAALVHDVGHGPLSHLIEKVVQVKGSRFKNHNERTRHIIENELADAIKNCGSSADWVARIVDKKDPLSQFISHKTIGADKIAYLRVDQYHAAYPPSPLLIGDLANNLIYFEIELNGIQKKVLGADQRMLSNLMDAQTDYFKMYKEVYWRKYTRGLERIVERSAQQAIDAGVFTPDEVWGMSDERFLLKLIDTKGEWSAPIESLYNGERSMLKAAMVLRMPGHEDKEIVRGKPIAVVPIAHGLSKKLFEYYSDPISTYAAEQEIAKVLKITPANVILSVAGDPYRMLPEDVQLFVPDGTPTGTIFQRYPQHMSALEELAFGVSAVRVMVSPSERERVAGAAKEVCDVLYEPLRKAA